MNEQNISKVIGTTIGLFPNEIAFLLTKNAVVVDAENLDLPNLVEATFTGLDKSISFRNDFDSLFNQNENMILSLSNENNDYSNLTGDSWTSIGTSVVGGLGSFFSSQNNVKSAQAQADAMRENAQAQLGIAQLQLQQEKLRAETALALAKNPQSKSSNTTLYVALGIGGVLILGLVIFAVTRKKQ